jgi:hypothetical protein
MEEGEIPAYVRHRLALVGWDETDPRPEFLDDVWSALYRHSAGVPRRLNMLMGRVLLHGAVEGLARIDGTTIDLVAADMAADRGGVEAVAPPAARPDPKPVERPRRRTSDAAPPTEAAPVRIVHAQDPDLLDRIAMLEERLDEQEAIVRRVLSMLIEWVEQDEASISQPHRAH